MNMTQKGQTILEELNQLGGPRDIADFLEVQGCKWVYEYDQSAMNYNKRCPVARYLQNNGIEDVWVGRQVWGPNEESDSNIIPNTVCDFIDHFDKGDYAETLGNPTMRSKGLVWPTTSGS
jgi:hypothetical protein